ncbi:spore germination protein [Brevibacillus sp. SYP-B805]|uniref:spore germination protein n=1 Tax=Brevibacillus sp. SYP-B805 TaxID=1578199 RepID=UPI0013ECFA67|nr:spore germination protein [Brevibacillus sp. SYP-B805]NGQ94401.1 spore germination protein [Brevibacillus sp. SYP-B805]
MKPTQPGAKRVKRTKLQRLLQKRKPAPFPPDRFSSSLEENIAEIRQRLGHNADFVTRRLIYAEQKAALFFFETLVDIKLLSEQVVDPLRAVSPGEGTSGVEVTDGGTGTSVGEGTAAGLMEEISLRIVLRETHQVAAWNEAVSQLLQGYVLLLAEGETKGLLIDVKKVEKRGIDEPDTEQSVIGPRESFVENLTTNITLIRQRLRDPHLSVEEWRLTRRGSGRVALFYLADVANPQIVQEVRSRLSRIDVDAIQGQLHLQELIHDNNFSLFPQMRPTERPDATCSYLLEGNLALMVDGGAHALIFPISFFQLLETVDDYYSSWQYATLIRFVRMLALLFSIVVPGLYLSLVAYNPELIPTRLVISMDAARVKVALPIVVEIFVMELMIEVLREAGLKLPKPIGQAVSIVGGLVIGDASVNANLVSPVTVVIVAFTAISSFTAPVYLLGVSFRILRFFLLLSSSMLGLYGFLLGLFLVHAHLARLVSFGVPYLAPLSPLRLGDWVDSIVRLSYKMLTSRPSFLKPLQRVKALSTRVRPRRH